MIRPLVTVSGINRPSVGISTDFVETSALSSLSTSTLTGTSLWDSASWDSATWASSISEVSDWANATALGSFASVKFQARTGVAAGGGAWGVGRWGELRWGSGGRSDETVRIQGFLVLFEQGQFL
jgi:hypothetical protein